MLNAQAPQAPSSGCAPPSIVAGALSADPDPALPGQTGCFAGLESAGALLLAVSGGPDSVALLLMASRWCLALGSGAPALHVATVDHGLRPESRSEAESVAALCDLYDLPHAILAWTGPKPASRVQERARTARYALLADHARLVGASHILTAHHADDQAETVLLRLGRGSGIGGLAGMRRLSPLAPDLWLARPLLDLTKAALVAVCRAAGVPVVDDPSNRDPAYARARLRARAPELAGLGLDTPGLLRLARRMAQADIALDAEVDRVEAVLRPVRAAGHFRADLAQARGMAAEIALRLLRRGIVHVATAPVRLERLEALAAAMFAALDAGEPYRATLAGTRVALSRDKVLEIWAEASRRRGTANASAALD